MLPVAAKQPSEGCTTNLCSTTEQAKTGTVPRRARTSLALGLAFASQGAVPFSRPTALVVETVRVAI